MSERRNLKAAMVMAVFWAGFVPAIAARATIYVDTNASGANNGTSWSNAYNYLRDALPVAGGDDIWVAEGTYKPDESTANPTGTNLRADTFALRNSRAVYGGFAGGETTLNERDWQTHETILSGDLDDNDVGGPHDPSRGENSYHVVTGSGTNASAILDGFTITGGQAYAPAVSKSGAGMYNLAGSPTVNNCTFSGNSASSSGGGMYNFINNPTVTNCTFSGNTVTSGFGGGMYNSNILADPTIIDCTFSGNTVISGGGGGMYNWGSATVTNCTFSNNSADDGGGMYNENSDQTITNCTFTGNSAVNGGGMYNCPGILTVSKCTFTGNTVASGSGGGMYNENSDPTVTNCTFSNNSADADSGGGMYNDISAPTVTNCTFSNNSADSGGGMFNWNYSRPAITNCTFSENSASTNGGGMYNDDHSWFKITNCIMWQDSTEIYFSKAPPLISYSNIEGCGGSGANWNTSLGMDSGGNIDAAPLFVDAGSGDLRLLAGSPCIDAGDNTAVPGGVTTDLDGNPRFVDGDFNNTEIVDMGAYEYWPRIFVDANATGNNNGSSWDNSFNYLQDALSAAGYGDEVWVAQSTYKPDANAVNPDGTANRIATFQLINGVAIYGGFAGGETTLDERDWVSNETILSGDIGTPDVIVDNSYHVVTGSGCGPNAILDGFTITAGNAVNFGGGVFNSSGSYMMVNCRLIGNSAGFAGGAVYNENYASPIYVSCDFIGNSASQSGGGMYNYFGSSPTVTNCTFTGNESSSGFGGGVYNRINSSPTVTNCAFSGNFAYYTGGMRNYGNSNPTVKNCILWGNVGLYNPPGESSQIETFGGVATIHFCCVQGWTGALGGIYNIGGDPLFVDADGLDNIVGTEDDNLRLSAGSPCIDAGDNTAVPADTADLDNDGNRSEPMPFGLDSHPRIIDGLCNDTKVVDMGAYEFNYAYMGDFDYDCDVDFGDFAILGLAWLSQPGDGEWNRFCDISIPADNYVDLGDLDVLIDNWLEGN